MAKITLSAEQKELAREYAKKKWPDETVTVEDDTDEHGDIIYRREKISKKPMPKDWMPKKHKKD